MYRLEDINKKIKENQNELIRLLELKWQLECENKCNNSNEKWAIINKDLLFKSDYTKDNLINFKKGNIIQIIKNNSQLEIYNDSSNKTFYFNICSDESNFILNNIKII